MICNQIFLYLAKKDMWSRFILKEKSTKNLTHDDRKLKKPDCIRGPKYLRTDYYV